MILPVVFLNSTIRHFSYFACSLDDLYFVGITGFWIHVLQVFVFRPQEFLFWRLYLSNSEYCCAILHVFRLTSLPVCVPSPCIVWRFISLIELRKLPRSFLIVKISWYSEQLCCSMFITNHRLLWSLLVLLWVYSFLFLCTCNNMVMVRIMSFVLIMGWWVISSYLPK